MSATVTDPRITAYVVGEMATEERAAFERELASDEGLREAVTRRRLLVDGVGAALGETPALAMRRPRKSARYYATIVLFLIFAVVLYGVVERKASRYVNAVKNLMQAGLAN